MQAKIWNNSAWIAETTPSRLKELLGGVILQSGFKVLDVMEHYFEPQGYTAIFLLAESHLAIHTFPEFGRTYVELSSCNLEYFTRYCELTKDWQ